MGGLTGGKPIGQHRRGGAHGFQLRDLSSLQGEGIQRHYDEALLAHAADYTFGRKELPFAAIRWAEHLVRKERGPTAGRAVAGFYYASDKQGIEHAQIMVILRTVGLQKPEVVRAIEESANLLAQVLGSGQRPEQAYLFDAGHLSKLPEDERP